eukprot:2030952-Amphidinium_carterae.1
MEKQSPQKEACFHLLQRSWVISLPLTEDEEFAEGEVYCQVLVVALRWTTTRFGTPPVQAIIAVPPDATLTFLEVLQTHVYMPESEESEGEVPVALVTVPGSVIWEHLTETVPVEATCLFFMEEKSDALPQGYELAALCDYPVEFSSGLVVRLTGDSSGEVLLN